MLEYISATSRMRDGISSNVALVAMKTKCVAARITKRSTATQTQPSSLSPTTTPQTTVPTTLRGLRLSQGHSECFDGPMVLRSPGSSPTKEE